MKTGREVDRGPRWFREMFEKIDHKDDWGVACAYDYEAWKLCKAVLRRQRRRTSDRAPKQ